MGVSSGGFARTRFFFPSPPSLPSLLFYLRLIPPFLSSQVQSQVCRSAVSSPMKVYRARAQPQTHFSAFTAHRARLVATNVVLFPWIRSIKFYVIIRFALLLSIFTALHGVQTLCSDQNSVCMSARPSVKRVHCDNKEERSVQIFILHERSFNLVFWEEWLVAATLLPEILGQPAPVGAKSPIFNRYSLVATQP